MTPQASYNNLTLLKARTLRPLAIAGLTLLLTACGGGGGGGGGTSATDDSSTGSAPSTEASTGGSYSPPEELVDNSIDGSDPDGVSGDTNIKLSWRSNPDEVDGYYVYFGTTAEAVTEVTSVLSLADAKFDADNPSVTYAANSQLGLSSGDTACFSISAYNGAGESATSAPVCNVL